MKSAALLLGLSLVVALTPFANAGTIVGSVHAEAPKIAAAGGGGGGAYDSRRYKFVEKIDYAKLVDFIVYIDASLAQTPATGPIPQAVTTQKDASFDPRVLPVAVGTTVLWPNEDDIYHNVFSVSEAKSFDLGNYKDDQNPPVVFDKVGRVDVFCGLHTKMHCIIMVLPNSFFAKTDAKGRYVIKDVPAGTYPLRAWHERLPNKTMEVVVPAEGEVKIDFVLGFGSLPKN